MDGVLLCSDLMEDVQVGEESIDEEMGEYLAEFRMDLLRSFGFYNQIEDCFMSAEEVRKRKRLQKYYLCSRLEVIPEDEELIIHANNYNLEFIGEQSQF
jgi:hypothetical protein